MKQNKKTSNWRCFFLLFFLGFNFPLIYYGQVPIKDFFNVAKIKTNFGYDNLRLYDINEDGFEDYILLGKQAKEISFHLSNKNMLSAKRKFFFFPVTDIIYLKRKSPKIKYHVFISRDKSIAGIFSFTKYGTMQLVSKIELKSYPELLNSVDINRDKSFEVFLYGPAFNGISLLKEKNFLLKRTSIVENKLFSDIEFSDLNYDGFLDIAAVNVIDNSLMFLFGDRELEFNYRRELPIEDKITNIKIGDLNYDSYNDIIYSTKQGFTVMKGDSVGSFSSSYKIEIPDPSENFFLADFNSDNFLDIAYLNKDSDKLNILYGKTKKNFYEPINYLTSEKILSFRVKKNKIFLLSKSGYIYKFSKINNNLNFNLPISLPVKSIDKFGYKKFTSFAFLDSINNQLNILLPYKKEIFNSILKIDLNNNYFTVKTFLNNDTLTVYTYKKGFPIYEKVTINLQTKKNTHKTIYSDFPIISILDKNIFLFNKSDSLSVSMQTINKKSPLTVIDSINNIDEFAFMSNGKNILWQDKKNNNLIFARYINGQINQISKTSLGEDVLEVKNFSEKNLFISVIKKSRKGEVKIFNQEGQLFSDYEINFPSEFDFDNNNLKILYKSAKKILHLFSCDKRDNLWHWEITDTKIFSYKTNIENVKPPFTINNNVDNENYIIYFNNLDKLLKVEKIK